MPSKLKRGDTIRIISPAGPVDEDSLNRGVETVESWGYRVEIGQFALKKNGYSAGTVEERLSDLTSALIDKHVSAVICSRGGYGSVRLLDRIGWDSLRASEPKLFIGFSDVSSFQLALLKICGWVSYSGPQAASLGSYVDEESVECLRSTISADGEPDLMANELTNVRDSGFNRDATLISSCLSMMISLIGTPYFPDLSDVILCLEDVNEPLYRIDRMFWQLKMSGKLESIEALVLGQFLLNGQDISEKVAAMVAAMFEDYSFPIILGLPYGHGKRCMTLPVGGETQLFNSIVNS